MAKTEANGQKSQLQRFKDAARNLQADESEEAFDRVLRKVASAKPAPASKIKSEKAKRRGR